jgi:hypothetical protein
MARNGEKKNRQDAKNAKEGQNQDKAADSSW